MNKAEYFHGRRSRPTHGYGAADPDPDLAERHVDDPFSVWDAAAELGGGAGRLSVAALSMHELTWPEGCKNPGVHAFCRTVVHVPSNA